jgi:hypothetical protein
MISSTKRRLARGIGAGLAAAGTCDPQATPIASVPYQADYVFING